MSETSHKKLPVLSIIVSLLLVTSGCIGGTFPTSDSSNENNSDDRVVSKLSDPSVYIDSLPSNQTEIANLSSKDKQRIENFISNIYNNLSNESNQRAVLLQSADDMCEFDREFNTELNESLVTELNKSTLVLGGEEANYAPERLQYAANITNRFNSGIPVNVVQESDKHIDNTSSFIPLLGSYNSLIDASCTAAQNRTSESIQEYQFATIMFGVDTLLVTTDIFYHPAYLFVRGTLSESDYVNLQQLNQVCGKSCVSLAVTQTHRAVNDGPEKILSTMNSLAAELNITITEKDINRISQEVNKTTEELLRLLPSLDSQNFSSFSRSVLCKLGIQDPSEYINLNETDDIIDNPQQIIGGSDSNC